MNVKNSQITKVFPIAIAFISVVILGLLVALFLSTPGTKNSDVSVATEPPQIQLVFVPSSSSTGFKVGDSVSAKIVYGSTNTSVGAAEVGVLFDPTVLKVTNLVEDSASLGVNKVIDNNTGKLRIDVAKIGDSNYVQNQVLANVTFQVLNVSSSTTILQISPDSKLGIPNIYTTNSGNSFSLTLTSGSTTAYCGDNIKNGSEICDGNSKSCTNSSGYAGTKTCNTSCSGFSSCTTTLSCGDGKINGNETCDDGNKLSGDGCSATCKTESTTTSVCGNGTKEGAEICDDGNTSNNDRCSNDCKNSCASGMIWDGTKCVTTGGSTTGGSTTGGSTTGGSTTGGSTTGGSTTGGSTGGGNTVSCKADYNKNSKIDSPDLGTFSLNYKKSGISCEFDLVNNDCYLDLFDFREFARIYNQTCSSSESTGGGSSSVSGGSLYGVTSPFNKLIPASATYTKDTEIGSVRHNEEVWSAPVYRLPADHNVPNVKITNTFSGRGENWPIPTTAKPAAESDAHLIVLDAKNKKSYEFWEFKWNSNGTISAGGMKDFPLEGNGISNPINNRVTASGFAITSGMILRNDFTDPSTGQLNPNGKINHALAMSLNFDKVKSGARIPPSVGGETNGRNGDTPMGMLYALPKNADVESMTDIHPLSKAIAIAMRDYGVYVNDTNGTPKYNNKYVGAIRIEPGLIKEMYGVNGDTLMDKVKTDLYKVIEKYGIYKVSGIDYSFTGVDYSVIPASTQ